MTAVGIAMRAVMACLATCLGSSMNPVAHAQIADTLGMDENLLDLVDTALDAHDVPETIEFNSWTVPVDVAGSIGIDAFKVYIHASPASWLTLSASTRKERGEAIQFDVREQWLLGEQTAANATVRARGMTLVAGDFRIRSAAAVSGTSARGTIRSRPYPARSIVRPPVLAPYAGTAQAPAPRGVGMTGSFGKRLNWLAFVSSRREDGTTVLGQSSFRSSWTVNSGTALSARRNLTTRAAGGAVSFRGRPGGTSARSATSLSIVRFSVPGRTWWAPELGSVWYFGNVIRLGHAWARGAGKNFPGPERWYAIHSELVVTGPEASVTLYRDARPARVFSPWGAPARASPHASNRAERGWAFRIHPRGAMAVSGGMAWYEGSDRVRSYVRMDGQAVSAEWVHEFSGVPGPEAEGRNRLRIRLDKATQGPGSARATILLTGAGGRGATIQGRWRNERSDLVVARTFIWGVDPDPWTVLTTPGSAGQVAWMRFGSARASTTIRYRVSGRSWGRWEVRVAHEQRPHEDDAYLSQRSLSWTISRIITEGRR